MDINIVEHLPKEIVNTLNMYFDEGKYVNDFRITGNSKGFSITLHFCNPVGDLDTDTWSPGLKHKSPSARKHDQKRRLKWDESILKSPTLGATDRNNPQPTSSDKGISCDLYCAEIENVNTEVEGECQDNSEEQLHELAQDLTDNYSIEHDSSHMPDVGDSVIRDDESDNTEKIDEAEMQYRQNLLRTHRNKSFHKIVHDTRNGQSMVYGLTDDIIISVDEINMKYNSWAVHDRNSDEELSEIYNLVHKWPRANPKKCRYGVDTLDIILPDIVAHQKQEYMGKDEEA